MMNGLPSIIIEFRNKILGLRCKNNMGIIITSCEIFPICTKHTIDNNYQ